MKKPIVGAGIVLAAILVCLMTVFYPLRRAASAPPAAGSATLMPEVFNGTGPALTLATDELSSGYRIMTLVDPTGGFGLYCTRGDAVSSSGETFLVAYRAPLTMSAGLLQPQAGKKATLILISVRDIEAITDIRPSVPTQGPVFTGTTPASGAPAAGGAETGPADPKPAPGQ